jgi:putative ABC transport system permease protein
MRGLFARVRSLVRGVRRSGVVDAEMEEEFRFHIGQRTADLIASGLSPAEARRLARLEFGSVERYREEGRQHRGLGGFDALRLDLRHAVRALGRAPLFTAVAVLTLALGVGANAAVFSMVSAVLLRPLPFPEADRLVVLYQQRSAGGASEQYRWSYAEFEAIRTALSPGSPTPHPGPTPGAHVSPGPPASSSVTPSPVESAPVSRVSPRAFEAVVSYYADDVNLSAAAVAPVRVRAEMVSAAYFDVLRTPPALGRGFIAADESEGTAAVAVLSHALWCRTFGAADVVGAWIRLNEVPVLVVGIAPAGFHGLTGDADVWYPHAAAPRISFPAHLTSTQRFLSVVARLSAGWPVGQARAEAALAAPAVRVAVEERADGDWTVDLSTLGTAVRQPGSGRAQLLLLGAAAFVLVIALVNLSGLLLARGAARARDVAVREALGAGRGQLVRHALAEGGLLGLLGGALGALLGALAVRGLVILAPERFGGAATRVADLAAFSTPVVDWRVAGFAFAAAVSAGLLAALVPALRGTRADLTAALKSGGRADTARVGSLRRPTTLTVAAVTQVACSLALLAGAVLLLQGFRQLRGVDAGFEPAGVLAFRVSPPESRYGGDAAAPLLERVLERVAAMHGVESATVGLCTPYDRCSTSPLYMEGRPVEGDAPLVGRHYVAPDHFRTLRIPLLRGRALDDGDRAGRPRVAVINETAARRFWPGVDPIGRRVRFGSGGGFASPDSLTEIVGIVGDVRYGGPGVEPRPDFYTSYLQFTWPHAAVMVRTTGDPLALVPALRAAVAGIDPNLPIHDVRTLQQRGADVLASERFAVLAVAAIAGLGLLLTALGIYGIMAWSVARMRREIGIRMAIGATSAGILRLVMGHGTALAAAGLVIGAAVALGLLRVLHVVLPFAAPAGPLPFAIASVIVLAVAAFACWLPARAAVRTDPVEVIAAE